MVESRVLFLAKRGFYLFLKFSKSCWYLLIDLVLFCAISWDFSCWYIFSISYCTFFSMALSYFILFYSYCCCCLSLSFYYSLSFFLFSYLKFFFKIGSSLDILDFLPMFLFFVFIIKKCWCVYNTYFFTYIFHFNLSILLFDKKS